MANGGQGGANDPGGNTPSSGSGNVLDAVSAAAIAGFQAALAEFGLEELAGWAAGLIGVSPAEFQLQLEQQPAYRARFAPVFERRERIRAGERLPALTAAQQMDFERRSRELESFYGLPSGFIDVGEALANDVSVDELYSRAALARNDAIEAFNSEQGRAVMEDLLGQPGISEGGLLAFFIDPDRSLPELQRATDVAQIAAAAGVSEFALSTDEAAALSDAGFDPDQITQRAAALTSAGTLRFGAPGEFGALSREQELEALEGAPSSLNTLQRRADQLRSRFDQGGGFARSNLGAGAGLGTA